MTSNDCFDVDFVMKGGKVFVAEINIRGRGGMFSARLCLILLCHRAYKQLIVCSIYNQVNTLKKRSKGITNSNWLTQYRRVLLPTKISKKHEALSTKSDQKLINMAHFALL